VDADGGLEARVDPDRVRQAVDDLLDNAFRHGPDRGSIVLSATRDDGRVRVSVEDDGPGFPSAVLAAGNAGANGASATDSAPQAGDERAHEPEGLGLVVARAIAEGHGGELVLENPTEGGARASLLLPD
jgi:signal transduction histidine kinase